MLHRVSNCLADKLVHSGVITPESKSIYIYGLEVLLSSIISTSLILIIGVTFGRFIDTLSFLIVFIVLRSFSGGFHANKYWLCTVVTISIYCVVMLLSAYIKIKIPLIVFGSMAPIGIAVLLFKAPIQNPNKNITASEAIRHKIVSVILFSLMLFSAVALSDGFISTSNTIFFTLIFDLTLLFVKTRYAETK